MSREKFIQAADNRRAEHLDDEARLILDGRTKDRRIRVYRGLAPGEQRAASIGYILIVTSGIRSITPSEEIIPAGSAAVRHPSFDSYHGRSGWSVQTERGTLFMPGETPDGEPSGSPYLDNMEIRVEPPVPAEEASVSV